MVKLEYRAVIKFLTKEGIKSSIIKRRMDKVYGKLSPSERCIQHWGKQFREGRESIEDGLRSGRPLLQSDDDTLNKNEFVNCFNMEEINNENVDVNQHENSCITERTVNGTAKEKSDPLNGLKLPLKLSENIKLENISDEEENFCSECSEQLLNKTTMESIKESEKENTEICSMESSQENTQPSVNNNETTEGAKSLKKNFCKYCCKYFANPYTLKTHIKAMHHCEGKTCPECGILVKANHNFRYHLENHDLQLRYRCKICQKAFKHRAALKRHMEIHDEDKFICAICGEKLGSRSSLNRHKLKHSDTKCHNCPCCELSFKRADHLKLHVILHTDLKPYACIFCKQTFAIYSNCRVHLKKSHAKLFAEYNESGKPTIRMPNVPTLEQLLHYVKNTNKIYAVKSKSKSQSK